MTFSVPSPASPSDLHRFRGPDRMTGCPQGYPAQNFLFGPIFLPDELSASQIRSARFFHNVTCKECIFRIARNEFANSVFISPAFCDWKGLPFLETPFVGVSHLHFACFSRGKHSEKGEGVWHPIGHVETPKTP